MSNNDSILNDIPDEIIEDRMKEFRVGMTPIPIYDNRRIIGGSLACNSIMDEIIEESEGNSDINKRMPAEVFLSLISDHSDKMIIEPGRLKHLNHGFEHYDPYFLETSTPLEVLREVILGESYSRLVNRDLSIKEYDLSEIYDKKLLDYRINNLNSHFQVPLHIEHEFAKFLNTYIFPLLLKDTLLYVDVVNDKLQVYIIPNIYKLILAIERMKR